MDLTSVFDLQSARGCERKQTDLDRAENVTANVRIGTNGFFGKTGKSRK